MPKNGMYVRNVYLLSIDDMIICAFSIGIAIVDANHKRSWKDGQTLVVLGTLTSIKWQRKLLERVEYNCL